MQLVIVHYLNKIVLNFCAILINNSNLYFFKNMLYLAEQ